MASLRRFTDTILTKPKKHGKMIEMQETINESLRAVQSELDVLTNIIANTVPVEEIYLFGSYAYGTPHKDSDLDL
jgi:predicted nucleotidyltransferase